MLQDDHARTPALHRLITEDAAGQLRRNEGLMSMLGSENGVLKLDWVEGVARLLADTTKLEEVEAEASAIWKQGIRHLIWAGMGGSVIAVRVLCELVAYPEKDQERIMIYPLDSTDPAALNQIVRQIAESKHLVLPEKGEASRPSFLATLLADVMMVGVSMGMTSEEPITHLRWFTDLLEQAQLPAAEHLLVMTLPGSYLDEFAKLHQVPGRPLQLDGRTGTGGRMSAPTTRVFLLPAALVLTHLPSSSGQLRSILEHAWDWYDLGLATTNPTHHPFVQLAAALSDASLEGVCRLLLSMPEGWHGLVQWIEQLMEESLGKDGKGVIVFEKQALDTRGLNYRTEGTLHVFVEMSDETINYDQPRLFRLVQPYLRGETLQDRLAALAASFLGWQLSMALYGYLHQITFAGQPAVEDYKARARILREEADPLQSLAHWETTTTDGLLTLFVPQSVGTHGSAADVFARMLKESSQFAQIDYLDLTFNGEFAGWTTGISQTLYEIGNSVMGVPIKIRRAPAAYHSTEQSEMDGSPYLISLRVLTRQHEESMLGTYSDTFLLAQGISTFLAMLEQGRGCLLLLIDGANNEAEMALQRFLQDVLAQL